MDNLSNMDMGWYDMGLNFHLFLRLSPSLLISCLFQRVIWPHQLMISGTQHKIQNTPYKLWATSNVWNLSSWHYSSRNIHLQVSTKHSLWEPSQANISPQCNEQAQLLSTQLFIAVNNLVRGPSGKMWRDLKFSTQHCPPNIFHQHFFTQNFPQQFSIKHFPP